mmetsp:Transcript_30166/g.63923  ORF Transcript_30166/g.63923 Transcript_30166/m.63923 type:complete len:116 (+) Transcript_30166:197-544(+)|eukprot:CAMPEP_0172305152 /NCGR_PEP_ID=MMETSP1058-20130122/6479_1 /TAXON_ID=83371 /ORGANISM="Detonula confervacea, Strain CCMP 353" /LENGTH=115 /DNA_ID=CAMNT_0013016647 /DNA_START=573 /DNA_END=920 /DNA_ORIENTATION=-
MYEEFVRWSFIAVEVHSSDHVACPDKLDVQSVHFSDEGDEMMIRISGRKITRMLFQGVQSLVLRELLDARCHFEKKNQCHQLRKRKVDISVPQLATCRLHPNDGGVTVHGLAGDV